MQVLTIGTSHPATIYGQVVLMAPYEHLGPGILPMACAVCTARIRALARAMISSPIRQWGRRSVMRTSFVKCEAVTEAYNE
jgi:hypothetical protein